MVFISSVFALFGRIFLSLIFILSGLGKLMNVSGTEAAIVGTGLPAGLAIPTGVFELVAGLFILLGFLTRITAILLAGFCLLTALFFHNELSDPVEQANMLKNIALAGGFLVLFAYGNTRASLDTLRARRREQVVVRDRVIHETPGTVVRDGDTVVPADHVTTTRRL